jgi:hypothetical protein
MRILPIITLAFLLLTCVGFAQPASAPVDQKAIGLRYLDAVIHGRDSVAWSMTDPKLQRAVPFEQFVRNCIQIRKMGSVGGFAPEFEQLAMRAKASPAGPAAGRDQVFTFKADTTYPPRFTISVSFETSTSTNVLGVGLNDMPPGPSAFRPGAVRITARDQDISGQEGWLVGGDSVAIDGVTLVLFPRGEVLMVIKVIREIVDGPDADTRAQEAALPIVRYALDHQYRRKATDFMLAYPDMKLLENMGVVFIIPGTTRMYRTQITPEQYNAK